MSTKNKRLGVIYNDPCFNSSAVPTHKILICLNFFCDFLCKKGYRLKIHSVDIKFFKLVVRGLCL